MATAIAIGHACLCVIAHQRINFHPSMRYVGINATGRRELKLLFISVALALLRPSRYRRRYRRKMRIDDKTFRRSLPRLFFPTVYGLQHDPSHAICIKSPRVKASTHLIF